MEATGIAFEPLVAPWLLFPLGVAAALAPVLAAAARAPGAGWRSVALAALWMALANPTLETETRKSLDSIAALVVDRSRSQEIGGRPARTDEAAAEAARQLEALPGIETRLVVIDRDDGARSTRLFGALARALSDAPPERIAGIVAITDGQVHDASEAAGAFGPLHVLLTGAADERDRRLVVERAPGYGVVGDDITAIVRVEDDAAPPGAVAEVEIRVDGERLRAAAVAIGEPAALALPVERAGPTAVEFSVAAGAGELTLANNSAAAAFNGVRDRLRVMLVSGEPNQSLRAWRNLLKSDPSVDLVHFTILRPPNKQDMTPVRELSLIPFPTNELFDARLEEFDLIVFDSYHRRGILPAAYLANVVEYVVNGGAAMDAAGPAFASPLSIAGTPVGSILPGRPTGRVFREGFVPRLTAEGRRHPVTRGLPGSGGEAEPPSWGRWFRQIDVEPGSGTTLMAGYEDRPLLLLDRIGDGRVAQLLSDHSWLWTRGYAGGGPQSDLMRRLVHWLMKEPDLEEDALVAVAADGRIAATRRSIDPIVGDLVVTGPDGETASYPLEDPGDGRATVEFTPDEPGLYRFAHDGHTAVAVVGAARGRELDDVRTTAGLLAPIAEASGGGVHRLEDGRIPDIRRVREGRELSGRGWIGLIDRRGFDTVGLERTPLAPAWALLLAVLGGLLLAWRAEGR